MPFIAIMRINVPIVDISILHVTVKIACQDGEESRLHYLAERLSKRLQLLPSLHRATDAQVLAVAAMLAEDVGEKSEKMLALAEKRHAVEQQHHMAEATNALADYIETLAQRYELAMDEEN